MAFSSDLAPQSFSGFAGELLVGMFGSGLITSYNVTTGAWTGNMLDAADIPVHIPGLWAIAFGNGDAGGPTNTLYFASGPYGEAHGIFGKIVPHPGF